MLNIKTDYRLVKSLLCSVCLFSKAQLPYVCFSGMNGTCSMHEGKEKCTNNFCPKI